MLDIFLRIYITKRRLIIISRLLVICTVRTSTANFLAVNASTYEIK
jgi:hypothetical protein